MRRSESIFRQWAPAWETCSVLALDFDGTLISGHFLPQWVWWLMRRSPPRERRIRFMVHSHVCGGGAKVASMLPATAPWAVRTAYRVFRGVPVTSLEQMVCGPRRSGAPPAAFGINRPVFGLLAALQRSGRVPSRLEIHSQGAPRQGIRCWLRRADVRSAFHAAGIQPDGITIHANHLRTDSARPDLFSGELGTPVVTKFSRIGALGPKTLFIGDGQDQTLFRRAGIGRMRFVNWRQAAL